MTLYFRAVGVTFVDGYPENLLRIRSDVNDRGPFDEPMPALLIRNPDNPTDPNAVEVHAPAIGRVGSVPRHLAAILASAIDSGVDMRAHIEAVLVREDHPERPGISIGWEPAPAKEPA